VYLVSSTGLEIFVCIFHLNVIAVPIFAGFGICGLLLAAKVLRELFLAAYGAVRNQEKLRLCLT
jgi:hypothetical protein